jgi:hypothetical protein
VGEDQSKKIADTTAGTGKTAAFTKQELADEIERRSILSDEIKSSDLRVNAAVDNGLFDTREGDKKKPEGEDKNDLMEQNTLFCQIQDKLSDARNKLYSGS